MDEKTQAGKPMLMHPFSPVFDAQSTVLVLGSFPSVISRENAFYYGHPQNRFWLVLSVLFSEGLPGSVEEKTEFLHRHHIALWDVVAACTITGSADRTLSPYQFNDIVSILKVTNIHSIFANGQKAGKMYQANIEKKTGIPIVILPSSSPANAAWTINHLVKAWDRLRDSVQNA